MSTPAPDPPAASPPADMSAPAKPPTPTADPSAPPQSVPNMDSASAPTTAAAAVVPMSAKQSAEAPDAASSMFGSWGFDVKAVTDNMGIGNLFAAPDAVDPDGVDVGERSTDNSAPTVLPNAATDAAVGANDISATADELGAKAAQLATSATAELGNASKAAQETIGKAAEEIGRGWGNLNSFLDDMLAPDKKKGIDGVSDAVAADADAMDVHAKFRELFPDQPADDEVVDHYRCVLLQKYRCYLNNATPEKTFALRGRLFVTTAMIAMYVADDGGAFGGQQFGVAIPFQDVAKIQKGAKSMLRVVSKAQTSFIFADFESDTHYSGALSLLEHMTGASAPLPVPASSPESADTAPAVPTETPAVD